MENENIIIVKKKNTIWTVIAVLLALGAVCIVALKLYQKFFKKKKTADIDDAEALAELNIADDAGEEIFEAEEIPFEVSAEAVIANAEDMAEVEPDEA